MTMKKTIIVIITCVCIAASANAQQGSGRLSLGTGLLYKNGMDITLAYEHEMNYAQTIELTPALVLESGKTFRHGYRNVIVVKKMTFPNDKLLTIEMTEKQISGRNISLNIDYEDILAADSFHADLLEEE